MTRRHRFLIKRRTARGWRIAATAPRYRVALIVARIVSVDQAVPVKIVQVAS